MLYFGWIFAAFLLGVLLTVGAAVCIDGHRSLRERFRRLGTTERRDYAEIMEERERNVVFMLDLQPDKQPASVDQRWLRG